MTPDDIYALVAKIPYGKVSTYGQLALLAGKPNGARQVGHALAMAPAGLPCHRVVNHMGRTASHFAEQKALLQAEGVPFRKNGCVNLHLCLWNPYKD